MAWDAYLSLDPPLKGESKREGHEEEIEVNGFSFGGHNPSSVARGSGGGAGRVDLRQFTIHKFTDASSVDLFRYLCAGNHFKSGKLTLYKAGGEAGPLKYLVYEFKVLYPEDMDWTGGEGGDEIPMETVSFAFEEVKVTYTQQAEDGTAMGDYVGGWNLRQNKLI
jgi:type VI secretion system secreted protein Hcp